MDWNSFATWVNILAASFYLIDGLWYRPRRIQQTTVARMLDGSE